MSSLLWFPSLQPPVGQPGWDCDCCGSVSSLACSPLAALAAAMLEVGLPGLFWWIRFQPQLICVLSGSSTRSKCNVKGGYAAAGGEDFISKTTEPFYTPLPNPILLSKLQGKEPHPPGSLGTPCTSWSINPAGICCRVVPALMYCASRGCRSLGVLGSVWMGMAAEMHSCIGERSWAGRNRG